MKQDKVICFVKSFVVFWPRIAVRYGRVRWYGTPQFLLRSTVRWYGTPFLQRYEYGTLVQYVFLVMVRVPYVGTVRFKN